MLFIKLCLVNKLSLIIFIICTSSLFAQSVNKEIKYDINSFLETVYSGFYEVNTIFKLDEHLGDMRYHDIPTEDPYGTLMNCCFFVAEALDGPENLGNIVGVYRNGNVLWHSNQNEISIEGLFNLFTTKDINNDGQVDILITSSEGTEIWIYSWDGVTGKRINDKNYWASAIQGAQDSFTLFDAEGDGVWEIRSLAVRDGSESWSWNGQLYGKWHNTPKIPDTAWLPRKNVDVNVNCRLTKRDNIFVYTYTIHSLPTSKQRINYFTVECKIKNVVKNQPEGWDSRINWVWDQEGWGTKVFYWDKPKEVLPGETLDSFKLESSSIPFISLYVVRGENMLPLTTEYTSKQDSIDFVNNSVKGFTIAPVDLPSPLIPSNFLDTLLNYSQQSLQLGWIKNQSTADKYSDYFTTAKSQLQQNNINAVKNILNQVLHDVDIDSTSSLTSEAYALLRYNTEYLRDNLPETTSGFSVRLTNSSGNLLTGGALKYYDGGWKDAADNGDGTFSIITDKPSLSLRMNYEYGSQTISNVPAQNNTYTFSTVNTTVQLKNSSGNLINEEGAVKYYAAGWRDFGTTVNGTATKELLSGNYSFRMSYAFGSNDKQQNIGSNPTITFQTVNTAVQLQNSRGQLIDEGIVEYYAGGWRDLGTTVNGTASKELLPNNYNFRMNYAYSSIDKQQNIGDNPSVVFQTVNASVQLKNSQGQLIDEGTVKYYAGGWRELGTTVNGTALKELLPNNYSFRMTYAYASIDKQQNVGDNPVVVFQTFKVSVQLKNSTGQLIDEGNVKYYAGGWRDFGSTVNGITSKELLPDNYSFRMTYEYISNDKQQNIGSDNIIDFSTILCTVKVNDTQNQPVNNADIKYYAGGWRRFGTTSNGDVSKELLPSNITFRGSYNGINQDIQQNIGDNPVVEIYLP